MKHATLCARSGHGLAVAAATLMLAGLTAAAPASAGGVADVNDTADRLGVRMARPVSQVQPGRTYEVIVEDPHRLSRHGIEGVQRGQRLQVTLSRPESARATGNNPFLDEPGSGSSAPGKRAGTTNPFLMKIEGMPGSSTARHLPIRADGSIGAPISGPYSGAGGRGFAKPGSGAAGQGGGRSSPARDPAADTDLGGPFDRASPQSRSGPAPRGDYPAPDNFDDSPDGTTAGGGPHAMPDRRGPIRSPQRGNGGQGPLGRAGGKARDATGPGRHFDGRRPRADFGDVPDGTESGRRGRRRIEGAGAQGDVPDGTEFANPTPTDAMREGKDPHINRPDGTTGAPQRNPRADHGPVGTGPGIQPKDRTGTPVDEADSRAVRGAQPVIQREDGTPGSGSGEAADKASPKIQEDQLPAVQQKAPQLQQGPGGPAR